MFGTPGNISIILVSVFCFVYGFFISMGKADWALKNQRKQLFPIDFEKSFLVVCDSIGNSILFAYVDLDQVLIKSV